MKKKPIDCFIPYLREFFTIYLPKQKNCSPHTAIAYRQTWNMLLEYVCSSSNKRLENISFNDFDRAMIMGFLDEMEDNRGWKPTTRNHRLGCIRSFFKFVVHLEPVLIIYLEDLKGIPLKKSINKSRIMEFMSLEATTELLRQPDVSKKMGVRDMFFMVLMYDTAARDCEMLSMRFGDIDIEKRTVYLLGKGSKPRLVPISDDTIEHFLKYANLYHQAGADSVYMFYTVRHRIIMPMSDDNVARFINKYGVAAKAQCTDFPCRVTPHMLRRSRAMHLYRAGMPLALLAEWLGHENPETTLVYAYADTEMKRKAIVKAESASSVQPSPVAGAWVGNEDMIKRLCGLV